MVIRTPFYYKRQEVVEVVARATDKVWKFGAWFKRKNICGRKCLGKMYLIYI